MTEIQLKNLIKACVKTLNEGLGGLNRKELDDMLDLRYIHGVSPLDKLAISKKHRLHIYDFIMRKCRWILNFEYPMEGRSEWATPFRHFFKDEGASYEDWMYDFRRVLFDELNSFKYWRDFDPKQLGENPYWIKNYNTMQSIEKRIPTFERDLTNLLEYVNTFNHKTAVSPLNPDNYPIYVSLYKPSREYGGPEEGGWHYTHNEYVMSIKVNNFKETRVAAVKIIREMPTHAYGDPKIYLEKTPRFLETKERPHYS